MRTYYKLVKTTSPKETVETLCSCITLDEAQYELSRIIFLRTPSYSRIKSLDELRVDREYWTEERVNIEIACIRNIMRRGDSTVVRTIYGDDVLVQNNSFYYEDYTIEIIPELGTCEPFNPEMLYPAAHYDYVKGTRSMKMVEGKNLQCLTYYSRFIKMGEDFYQDIIGFIPEHQRAALAKGTVWTNYERTLFAVYYIPEDPKAKMSVLGSPIISLTRVRGLLMKERTWVSGFLEDLGQPYTLIKSDIIKGERSRYFVDNKTLGIFTGMFDINSEPIYTDDIIEITCPSDKEYLMNFGGKIVHRVSPIPEFGCYGFTQDRTESELREEYDNIFGENPRELEYFIPFHEYYAIGKKFVWSLRELLMPKSDRPSLEVRIIGNVFDNPELLEQETIFLR